MMVNCLGLIDQPTHPTPFSDNAFSKTMNLLSKQEPFYMGTFPNILTTCILMDLVYFALPTHYY